MKNLSSVLAHGITHAVSKKKNDGWTTYPRGDGSGFGISFRISVGVWRDRRIPPSEARTPVQAERWARANVERLRAGEPVVPATPAKPVLVRVAEQTTGVTSHALRLIALQIAVGAGAMPAGEALALLREQAAYFEGMADMAADDAQRAVVEPMLALYELFLGVIENAAKGR